MSTPTKNDPDDDLLFQSFDYKGSDILIGDLPVYKVGTGSNCIIYAYDIYGTHGGRTRFICDYIASKGYTVYLPDFFRNTAWIPGEVLSDDFYFWIKLHNKYNIKEDIYEKLIPYAEDHGTSSFAIIGIHWGAFVVFNVSDSDKFKCGVSIDPAVYLGVDFKEQELELYKKVKCPQLLIVSEEKHIVDKYYSKVAGILKAQLGKDFYLEKIEGGRDGFFSAQDINNENIRKLIKKTIDIMLKYIASHI